MHISETLQINQKLRKFKKFDKPPLPRSNCICNTKYVINVCAYYLNIKFSHIQIFNIMLIKCHTKKMCNYHIFTKYLSRTCDLIIHKDSND